MISTLLPVNLVEPDYITLTDIERNFDIMYWRKKFLDIWIISVYLSVAYLVLVFGGIFLMKTRKPFKLNGLLTIWNIGLSVMSILAFCRGAPELFHNLSRENGFYHSVCEWRDHNPASAFWGFVLMCSKVVEFGDTAFIVLRKQNLKFIHWYHHIITATSWWLMYPYYEPITFWYVVMNAFVHSVMYPYYAFRSMKVSLPKIVPMIVTAIQVLQMFGGIYVNIYSVFVMYIIGTPADCPHRIGFGVFIGSAIYGVFVILFGRFFINSYINKGKVKAKKI